MTIDRLYSHRRVDNFGDRVAPDLVPLFRPYRWREIDTGLVWVGGFGSSHRRPTTLPFGVREVVVESIGVEMRHEVDSS